jgi:5'-methylthioadenosine nucleosidase
MTTAMEAEALPMVKALELQLDEPPQIPPPAPCLTYSGQHAGITVHLVVAGKCRQTGMDNVGTVPASLATYLALQVGFFCVDIFYNSV